MVYPSEVALVALPPARACWTIAISCGLATTTPAIPATATARSLTTAAARVRRPASQGARASTATIRAITADSWLTSAEPPTTNPRITPWPIVGPRRSRTAASSVSGRNTVP